MPIVVRKDTDAEVAVLGALLVAPERFWDLSLDASDFYDDRNRLIYHTITELSKQDVTADLVTVTSFLDRTGKLERIGGASTISSYCDSFQDVANVKHYADIVKKESNARKILDASRILVNSLANGQEPDLALESFDSDVSAISNGNREELVHVSGVAERVVAAAEEARANPGQITYGVETHIRAIDKILLPFSKGDLYVIGGGPSIGKSSFMDQIAMSMANHGEGIAMFALEMTREQRVVRMVSKISDIPVRNIITGYYSEDNAQKVFDARRSIEELSWWIDDTRGLTPFDIRARIRRLQSQQDIAIVFIDYLQLVRPQKSHGSREREVAEMTHSFAEMAGMLNVPIVLASQFSRTFESEGRMPELRDFRESGAIEQDVAGAIALHRADKKSGEAVIRILKQRQGPVEDINVGFDGSRFEFVF